MATKKTSNDPRKMTEDEVVRSLIPDPSAVPDVKMISGFLGKSNQDGYWRLYLTPELSEYIEISEKDVLYHKDLDSEVSSLSQTLLWFKRDAKLSHTRTQPVEAQAEFLQGRIASDFLSGSRNELFDIGLGVQYPATYNARCALVSMLSRCPYTKFPRC